MPFLHFRNTIIALPREHSFCNKLRKLQTLIQLVAKYFFWLKTVSWPRECFRTSWSVANIFIVVANILDSHKWVFSVENTSKTKQLYSGWITYQEGPNRWHDDIFSSRQDLYFGIRYACRVCSKKCRLTLDSDSEIMYRIKS